MSDVVMCKAQGCQNEGLYVPKICVPIPMGDVMRVICDVPLCDKHMKEAEPRHFLSEAMKEQFVQMARLAGSEPVFDRAMIRQIAMKSDEYWKFSKELLEAKAKGEHRKPRSK